MRQYRICVILIENRQYTMEKTDLKPCPFCGAAMNLGKDGTIFGWHKVDCLFYLLEEQEADMTEEECQQAFVEAWNRRA